MNISLIDVQFSNGLNKLLSKPNVPTFLKQLINVVTSPDFSNKYGLILLPSCQLNLLFTLCKFWNRFLHLVAAPKFQNT